MSGFELSPYQIEIIDFIANGARGTGCGNLLVQAYAGCSKTSTIMESLNYIPKDKSVLLTCFNKRIANELQSKAPKHVEACTMNSLGFKVMRNFVQESTGHRVELNSSKTIAIVKEMINKGDEDYKGFEYMIGKLCENAKNHALIPKDSEFGHRTVLEDTEENWKELMDKYGISSKIQTKVTGIIEKSYSMLSKSERSDKYDELLRQYTNMVIRGSREALCKGIKNIAVIDFTDQLYLPFVYGISCGDYDYVFVDEAQDLNPIQHEMLPLCMDENSRLIAVGDRKQAIYQFRGSMSDSMDTLNRRFNCEEKILPLSYRCPEVVLKEAQVFVPDIKPALKLKGHVEDLGMYEMEMFKAGDMVLCRFNAPLVTIAYDLLIAHVPFEIRGRDFIGDLISMIMGFEVKTIEELHRNLEAWKFNQIDKKLKENPDANVSSIEDRYEAMILFLAKGGFKYVGQAVKKLKELQAKCRNTSEESGGGVILSTVHQAKGLEAKTVYFVNVAQLPCKYAKTEEEMEAERNIAYVGVTRSQENLFYIATATEALLNMIEEELEEKGECTLKSDNELLKKVLDDKRRYGLGFALKDFILDAKGVSSVTSNVVNPLKGTEDEQEQEFMKKQLELAEGMKGVEQHEVEGHWRAIDGVGKDQHGNRNQKGRTWVREHERGDKLPEVKDFLRIKKVDGEHYKEASLKMRPVAGGIINIGNADEVIEGITARIEEKHGFDIDPITGEILDDNDDDYGY